MHNVPWRTSSTTDSRHIPKRSMRCRIHANRAKTQLLCARMCAVKTLNSLRCPSNGAMRPRIPGDVPTATQAQLLRPIQSFTYNAVLSNSPTYTHQKLLYLTTPCPHYSQNSVRTPPPSFSSPFSSFPPSSPLHSPIHPEHRFPPMVAEMRGSALGATQSHRPFRA